MLTVRVSEKPTGKIEHLIERDVRKRMVSAFSEIAQEMPGRMQKVFTGSVQGRRDGEGFKWPDTTPIALKKRLVASRSERGSPTLRDTDRLMKSHKMLDFDPNGPGRVMEMLLGSDLPAKAGVHEPGAWINFGQGRRFVPPRRSHFMTKADRVLINAIFERHLASG